MAGPLPHHRPPSPNEPKSVSHRTQIALALVLASLVVLLGYRWIADRFGTRPTDVVATNVSGRVDLNRANRDELAQVPGIGPRLADRIVLHRDAGGKFQRVDDLEQVAGIGPASLQKLRPWLTVDGEENIEPMREPDRLVRKATSPTKPSVASSGKIDLNRATVEQLQSLPGIGPVLAQRMIDAREVKPFSSVDDLRRVSGIGPKRLDAIRELVTVGP